jgi:Spy/CpxP family protein refolding chaperone
MRRFLAIVAVLACAAALPLHAEPADGDKAVKAEKPKKLRLVKPWADLTSLNDEQKIKISEIHADYVEKMNQLRDEEEAAIMALLSEENKSELAQNIAEKKQADKERNAQRRAAAKAATTRPSGN